MDDGAFCECSVGSLLLGPSVAVKAAMTPVLSLLASLRWSVYGAAEGRKGQNKTYWPVLGNAAQEVPVRTALWGNLVPGGASASLPGCLLPEAIINHGVFPSFRPDV